LLCSNEVGLVPFITPELFGGDAQDPFDIEHGPPFIAHDGKLAISFGCIPPLMKGATARFNAIRHSLLDDGGSTAPNAPSLMHFYRVLFPL